MIRMRKIIFNFTCITNYKNNPKPRKLSIVYIGIYNRSSYVKHIVSFPFALYTQRLYNGKNVHFKDNCVINTHSELKTKILW